MKKIFLLTILSSSISFYSTAQEICDNELDDDGDGLIDCYDPDCGSVCPNTFFIVADTPQCQYEPTVLPTFTLQEVWSTPSAIDMDARQNAVIGDVDGDGVNEVIGNNDGVANSLFVFNGVTGAIEDTIICPAIDLFMGSPAIADCDRDGYAEIFVVTQSPDMTLRAFEYNPTSDSFETVFTSSQVGYSGVANWDRMAPELADFNNDSIPEVYLGNQIYNSLTGAKIMEGGNAGSKGGQDNNSNNTNGTNRFETFPVAADVLDSSATCPECAGLELVAGNQVYTLDWTDSTMTAAQSITGSNRNDGWTAVADFDRDGDLDGIVMSNRRVYVWDLQTNSQIGSTYTLSAGIGGRPNVADFDNDGDLEIGVAGNSIYVVIENNMSLKWSNVTTDGSARTGSSVFDFEGDGNAEVVYRDETTLYIFNGVTGDTISSVPCTSGTRSDYPMVVDVNNDGQAEIVCACGGSGGELKAFNSPAQSWVTSRKIWNQHGYHVTNINDDLTIPLVQQDHSLVADSLVINNFMVQATYLKYDGRPAFSAPDDSISLDSISMNLCTGGANDSLGLIFTVYNTNKGAWPTPAGTPISFYSGNPMTSSATLLGTTYTTVTLDSNESTLMNFNLDHPGGVFDLFALVNDNGLGTTPLSEPSTNIGECNYSNNLDSAEIDGCSSNLPLPVSLISFTASYNEPAVDLQWETASEENNSHFNIERLNSKNEFEKIGEVQGNGTTQTISEYTFEDYNIELGKTYYYRLKQVDYDQKFEYSNIQMVRVMNEQKGILEYYPNPTNSILNVSYESLKSEIYQGQITSMTGQVIKEVEAYVGDNIQFSMEDLPQGIYFLQVTSGTEKIVKRILKN